MNFHRYPQNRPIDLEPGSKEHIKSSMLSFKDFGASVMGGV